MLRTEVLSSTFPSLRTLGRKKGRKSCNRVEDKRYLVVGISTNKFIKILIDDHNNINIECLVIIDSVYLNSKFKFSETR